MDEIRKLVPVLDLIEEASASILLTEDQYQLILTKIKGFPFAFVSREIVQFVNDFESCPIVEVDKLGIPTK